MNLALPLLVLMLSHGASRASPSTVPRTPVKGKSGRTWFTVTTTAGASRTPVVDVFANATGAELVISFAVQPGGRSRIFVSPSTLSVVALSDFDVSQFGTGKL